MGSESNCARAFRIAGCVLDEVIPPTSCFSSRLLWCEDQTSVVHGDSSRRKEVPDPKRLARVTNRPRTSAVPRNACERVGQCLTVLAWPTSTAIHGRAQGPTGHARDLNGASTFRVLGGTRSRSGWHSSERLDTSPSLSSPDSNRTAMSGVGVSRHPAPPRRLRTLRLRAPSRGRDAAPPSRAPRRRPPPR